MVCQFMIRWQFLNVLVFLNVTRLSAEIFYTQGEDVEFTKFYFGKNGEHDCLRQCGDYCKEMHAVKVDCNPVKGKGYWKCLCKKRIPIRKGICIESNNQCEKFNFLPVYRDGKCYCRCSDNNCDSVCEKKGKLGKCIAEGKQKLNEDPCECYCEQEECARTRSSNFHNANCNADGICHVVCNGTQASVPGWCKLNSDRCGCKCANPECQTFARKNSKPHGICKGKNKCSIQFTSLDDFGCNQYCERRANNQYPVLVPSRDGYCKCNYNETKEFNVYRTCVQSATCSKNDYTFCQDDSRVSNLRKDEQTPCSGKLCWSPLVPRAQNISRPWVYATPKMETVDTFAFVLCRVNEPSIGLGDLKKINQTYSDCKYVTIPFDGIFYASGEDYHALLGTKYAFKPMKKNDPIPKKAFVQYGVYFGRDLKNGVFGTIDASGIMTGGRLNFTSESGEQHEWGFRSQSAVYPDTFEILVCTD